MTEQAIGTGQRGRCLDAARQGGEAHLDAQSPVRARPGADYRPVRAGYGGDDGQAQAGSAGFAHAVLAEPLERLQQALDLVGRHRGPGVGDKQHGAAVPGSRGDLDPAVRHVVAQRVVGKVSHQSFG
jgi:hypothetical protein